MWYKVTGGACRYLQVPGAVPRLFFYMEVLLAKELSIFVDESGDRGGKARYYLLTLVHHDQADNIKGDVRKYEMALLQNDIPNTPFHSEPLLNGHKDYEHLDIEQRKKMLVTFAASYRATVLTKLFDKRYVASR